MKILKFLSIFFAIVVSGISGSCTTNVEPIDPAVLNPIIDPNTQVGGAFKVDFSDQTYNSTGTSAIITGTTISITAIKSTTGENFAINLVGATVGDYSTTDKVSILYKEKTSDAFGFLSLNNLGTTASVSVTSINNATRRIKGTFAFIGKWNDVANTAPPVAIQFTNGTFDIPFTTPDAPIATFFKVDFSGQTFSTNTTTAILTNGQIIINASKGLNQQETFSIALEGNRLGDFTSVDDVINYVVANPDDYGYVNYTPTLATNTGKVTITQIDNVNKTISGTFNYRGYWSDFLNLDATPIEFTNGSFKIPYTESVVSNDTFFAKVNDVEFVESFIATAFATIDNVDVISINATNTSDDRISISINDSYTVGNTYSAVNEAKCSLKEDGLVSFANVGTVKILSKTGTKIKGIFSFTTVSGRTITEGAFDVEY